MKRKLYKKPQKTAEIMVKNAVDIFAAIRYNEWELKHFVSNKKE